MCTLKVGYKTFGVHFISSGNNVKYVAVLLSYRVYFIISNSKKSDFINPRLFGILFTISQYSLFLEF